MNNNKGSEYQSINQSTHFIGGAKQNITNKYKQRNYATQGGDDGPQRVFGSQSLPLFNKLSKKTYLQIREST